MNVTQKQAQFWCALLAMMIVVAVAVLFLDFGIKSAILEESLRLRGKIEEEEKRRGQKSSTANSNRIDNDASVDPAVPSDLLVHESTGLEEGSSPNGTKAKARIPRTRDAKPSGQD
jgi:hypothetical protein